MDSINFVRICAATRRESLIFSFIGLSLERLRNVDVVANRNEPYYNLMYAGLNRIDVVLLEALFRVRRVSFRHGFLLNLPWRERAFRYGDYCTGIRQSKPGTQIGTFVTHAQNTTVAAKSSQWLSTACLSNSAKQ
jgi:hypothetical protein